MRYNLPVVILSLTVVVLATACPEARAQYADIRVPTAPRSFQARSAPQAPVARNSVGRPISKPLSNIFVRPTVSPYLNLGRFEDDLGISAYHTLVRPQLEQIEFNRQQQVNVQRLNRQLQGLQTGIPTQGSESLRPTGHGATFMNFSHFYPGR